MADYILARKSRNIASGAVHIFLNILLGIGAVLVTVFSSSPLFGFLLVLVSKWRIFAVRRRYLWLNLKSNLVDLIVGMSVVLLSYYAGNTLLPVDFVLMSFYVIWLVIIKPLSSENATLAQSLIAVFLGISATTFVTAGQSPVFTIFLAFLVGYAASRHVLSQTSNRDFTMTTLVCGLIFAEIAWLCQSWAIVYTFGASGIRIPQVAIILTIFAFIYNYARQAIIRYQDDFRFRHIIGPVLFGVILVGIIVIWFSNPIFNI
ncbi:hypothetical protein J5868_00400 [Candidatus Saccharibacteria bacterium]|nr:hypothetical protein [Candidatus Saccharibacteria bacterium]MBQ1539958.1 hypothetical protein [Candidatus Saccharibacteria bacterium]